MKKIKITEKQSHLLSKLKENGEGLKSVGSSIGPNPIRVIIYNGLVSKRPDYVISKILEKDSGSKLNFYEATGKIVGTISEYKLPIIKNLLGTLDPEIIIQKKSLTKALKESRKEILITKEQYNRIFASGLINESINENSANLDNEVMNLIKYLYGKTNEFSPFWGQKNISYEDICNLLEEKGLIIKTDGHYQLSKSSGTPDAAISNIKNEISKLINFNGNRLGLETEASNYPPGTENDPNAPWNDNRANLTQPIIPRNILFKVIGLNRDIAILKGKNNSLYVFYYEDIDKDDFFDYAEVEKNYIGSSESGMPEYDFGDFEVDADVIERYVNNNLKSLTMGYGSKDFNDGIKLVKIDNELRDELMGLYDKSPNILKALTHNDIAEITTTASSGAFTSPLSQTTIKKDINVLDTPIVGETTTQTAGNYTYDTNALPGIGRDGTFKKHTKTKAEEKTQWAGGSFVKIDNSGSQTSADKIVKLKKTKGNINAPSLGESIINEALKLQHDKEKGQLIVISDLEGKEASKETFSNKNVLKQNGFNWNGSNWVISSDKLEVAKKTLSLVNKAEYLISTLEDVEEAVDNSEADNRNFLKAKLDQYIMDLANATDEAALSAEIRRYLTFFSKFHNYSFYNRILIYIQNPEATRVASYKKWQEKFRQVKKGAKSISILAPLVSKTNPEDNTEMDLTATNDDTNKEKFVRGFKAVRVFDISDTEPIDERGETPNEPKWFSDNTPSETADELFGYISEVAKDMGITVTSDKATSGEKGYAAGDHINISSDVVGGGRLATMIHEVAHELMHFKEKSLYYQGDEIKNNKAIKELQAESVSYVVLKHYGLPVTHHPTYLALWKANKEGIQNNLEAISKVSQFIIDKIDSEAAIHQTNKQITQVDNS